MSSAPQPLLPPEEEQSLHRRLCEQDALAPPYLCRVYLDPLVAWLRDRHRELEDDLVIMAAQDAVVGLIKNPHSYNPSHPSRLDLFGYLRMAAEGDLRNLLRREQRHHRGRRSWNVVENADETGNNPGREEDPALGAERAEQQRAAAAFLRNASAGWTEQERQLLELMIREETQTERIAPVLGVAHLPFEQQQKEVKRVRDRIIKRLQREDRRE
jgi:RNA polymerase sigma-70 factor (ECF subfamily)